MIPFNRDTRTAPFELRISTDPKATAEGSVAPPEVAEKNRLTPPNQINMPATSLTNIAGQLSKRMLDICLALPVVVLIFPPVAVLVRIGHWLQSPGPLFFRQERCGQHQKKFVILKFRTMNQPSPGSCAIKDDPEKRIFRFGAFLRNTKLDEIPQFINVLMGSMSIVGPRPHHFEDCEAFAEAVEDYSQRIIAKPGITGLAQITEYRGDFEWNCVESRVAKDLDYIRSWSLTLDINLIVSTVAVVTRKSLGLSVSRATPGIQPAPLELPVLRHDIVNQDSLVDSSDTKPRSERRAA